MRAECQFNNRKYTVKHRKSKNRSIINKDKIERMINEKEQLIQSLTDCVKNNNRQSLKKCGYFTNSTKI